MSKKVGERRQPCLTPMVVRRKGRLHWWLCYWAACGTARLENELSREKRQNGGLTTQKALLLPTIGRPLVWLSSGEDGSFPKGKKFWKKFGRHPRKFFWLLLPHHPCEFHSGLPMSFFFSFLLSLYLSSVLLSHVFSSSVLFSRRTFCPFCYPMSFSLQFSSFVKYAQHVSCDWRFFNCSAFAKDLAGCFSHCCDESVNWCIHFYVFYIERGGRC